MKKSEDASAWGRGDWNENLTKFDRGVCNHQCCGEAESKEKNTGYFLFQKNEGKHNEVTVMPFHLAPKNNRGPYCWNNWDDKKWVYMH